MRMVKGGDVPDRGINPLVDDGDGRVVGVEEGEPERCSGESVGDVC